MSRADAQRVYMVDDILSLMARLQRGEIGQTGQSDQVETDTIACNVPFVQVRFVLAPS